MPDGKPAGIMCVHLNTSKSCQLFGDPRRPALCDAFTAEPAVCGDDAVQALSLLTQLERDSLPGKILESVRL